MQQCGKMGSGARPEEAVPEGRRNVTRRASAAGICPYCGSEQVAKALPRRSMVRENGGYRRSGHDASTPSNGKTMLILPFHGGRDAAGSLTNTEKERPRRPCVRWCDERQTHFSIFPTAIVLYSVRAIVEYITLFNTNASSQTLFHIGVVPDPPSSKQPLHASNYHMGCLFVQK